MPRQKTHPAWTKAARAKRDATIAAKQSSAIEFPLAVIHERPKVRPAPKAKLPSKEARELALLRELLSLYLS